MRHMPQTLSPHGIGKAAAIALLLGFVSGCGDNDGVSAPPPAALTVARPVVEGPVTGGNGEPFITATLFDLGEVGYSSTESFIAGTATAYTAAGELPADGKWTVTPGDTAAYKTRLVVYRPIDPQRFNGTVVVEWLNVTGGRDAAPDWILTLALLNLAVKYGLPVVIHARESFSEILEILEGFRNKALTGIFHAYTGTVDIANQITDMGFKLGIGGIITYKKSSLPDVIRETDLKHLVLETDSPYLTPVPFRGKRNVSSYIPYIAEAIQTIKGIALEEIARITSANASQIFQLDRYVR